MSQVPFHFTSSSWAFPPHKLSSFTRPPCLWEKEYDLWKGKGVGSLQGKGDENEVDEGFRLTQEHHCCSLWQSRNTWGINEVVLGTR